MKVRNYQSLALSWVPDDQENRVFYIITAAVMAVVLVVALVVSSVDVPPKERKPKVAIPERVAKFITQKKKVEPPKPKVQPKPPPPPKPSPKPKVARKTPLEAEKKPLTASEKKARKKAEQSGLLALGSELADLMDTSSVDALVGGKVKKASSTSTKVAGVKTDVLAANVSQGSGGVSTSAYVAGVSSTTLSQREIALVKQSLVKGEGATVAANEPGASKKQRTGNVRTEEEVTIVFDQNKGQLFSLYNRERRKKPGLKGKLVLEITVAPDGSVTMVTIASTELNDPSLERRIVARVKGFKFPAKQVEPVTVTFPIEFLPS